MNIIEYIERLQKTFEKYGNIYVSTECLNEILSLTGKSGNEMDFICALNKFLKTICDYPIEMACTTKGIESVKGDNSEHLYAMRFKEPNIRIIFTINKDGTILLLAFFEKWGKKVTEYDKYKKPAQSRLKRILSEEEQL